MAGSDNRCSRPSEVKETTVKVSRNYPIFRLEGPHPPCSTGQVLSVNAYRTPCNFTPTPRGYQSPSRCENIIISLIFPPVEWLGTTFTLHGQRYATRLFTPGLQRDSGRAARGRTCQQTDYGKEPIMGASLIRARAVGPGAASIVTLLCVLLLWRAIRLIQVDSDEALSGDWGLLCVNWRLLRGTTTPA